MDGTLVIEEYIDDGEEYSVEVLTTNGRHEVLAITTKEVVMPYFIEAGHLLPAPLKMEDREAIQETVCSLLTSIGHLEGPSSYGEAYRTLSSLTHDTVAIKFGIWFG
ncbi:hypothetical protein X809_02710 [Paenibacillus polymyxa CR1]|nr:hypothetical protein X809_02710 [Paenibacillus polymyxa CR1]